MSSSKLSDQPQPVSLQIQGVFEACIGVQNLAQSLNYWRSFGYEIQAEGQLLANESHMLYAVSSRLHSIRLSHQDADHGLIRLMKWDHPTNQGLGIEPMNVIGNRWTASLTNDVMKVMNHVEVAQSQG